jgi:hypothetical protein
VTDRVVRLPQHKLHGIWVRSVSRRVGQPYKPYSLHHMVIWSDARSSRVMTALGIVTETTFERMARQDMVGVWPHSRSRTADIGFRLGLSSTRYGYISASP